MLGHDQLLRLFVFLSPASGLVHDFSMPTPRSRVELNSIARKAGKPSVLTRASKPAWLPIGENPKLSLILFTNSTPCERASNELRLYPFALTKSVVFGVNHSKRNTYRKLMP